MDKEVLDTLAKLAAVKGYINQLVNSSRIDKKQLYMIDAKGQFIDKLFIQGCMKLTAAPAEEEVNFTQRLLEEKKKVAEKKAHKKTVTEE